MPLQARTRTLLLALPVALAVAVLVVGGIFRGRSASSPGDGGIPEGGASAELPLPDEVGAQFSTDLPNPVTGVAARLDTLWLRVSATGSAEAIRRTTVITTVAGRVMAVPVREAGRVAAGELLVQIDTTEFALAVAAARGGLLQAEATFRELTLFDAEDATLTPDAREERRRYARARAQLDQREVDLRRAELQLERSSVRAPFPGSVADLRVVEGDYLNPGAELLTLVDLDPVKVEAHVLEREVANIAPGRRALLTFAAFPGERLEGRVESINPVLNPQTRTARVTVHLPNPGGRIRPGMYASVELEAEGIPDRVLVPRAAILERDGRPMVFVFEQGRARWRYVTPGRENAEVVEILEHPDTDRVLPGEVVLTNGHQYLFHEAPVRLVENVAAEGGRPTR